MVKGCWRGRKMMKSNFRKFIEFGNRFWTIPAYYVVIFCWLMLIITRHFFPDNKEIELKWSYSMIGAFGCFLVQLYIDLLTELKMNKKIEDSFTKKNPYGENNEK